MDSRCRVAVAGTICGYRGGVVELFEAGGLAARCQRRGSDEDDDE